MRWLLVLLVACAAPKSSPVARVASPGPICPPRPTTLMLPELERSAKHVVEIIDEQLFIDFVPTGIKEKEIAVGRQVNAFALRDGRIAFRIAAGGRVWDPRTQALSDIGPAQWIPVAGHGWLFQRNPEPNVVEWLDVDPDRTGPARLRTLFRATKGPKGNYLSAGIVGVLDGTIVAIAMSRDYDSETNRTTREGTLLCIAGKDDVATRSISLPNDLIWVGSDAIRDHRLLLVRSGNWGPGFGAWSTDAAVLDLDRGGTRVVGKAQGGHTKCTAVPHPHIEVKWRDDRTSHREPDFGDLVLDMCTDGGSNSVDPVTESVAGYGAQPLQFSSNAP